ncbi:MAG: hypothetical protein ACI85I_000303 [Arenicella sp.]|jgi:hypothetical protein
MSLFSIDSVGQNSQGVLISDASEVQKIGEYIYYLEDADGKLELSDILKEKYQTQFVRNDKVLFSTPATSSVYWFRVEIQNKSSENLHLQVGKAFGIWTFYPIV